MSESGIFIGGTAERVRDQWQAMYDKVPAEYITLIFHYAQQPKDDVIDELARFMRQVWPLLEAAAGEDMLAAE